MARLQGVPATPPDVSSDRDKRQVTASRSRLATRRHHWNDFAQRPRQRFAAWNALRHLRIRDPDGVMFVSVFWLAFLLEETPRKPDHDCRRGTMHGGGLIMVP